MSVKTGWGSSLFWGGCFKDLIFDALRFHKIQVSDTEHPMKPLATRVLHGKSWVLWQGLFVRIFSEIEQFSKEEMNCLLNLHMFFEGRNIQYPMIGIYVLTSTGFNIHCPSVICCVINHPFESSSCF